MPRHGVAYSGGHQHGTRDASFLECARNGFGASAAQLYVATFSSRMVGVAFNLYLDLPVACIGSVPQHVDLFLDCIEESSLIDAKLGRVQFEANDLALEQRHIGLQPPGSLKMRV